MEGWNRHVAVVIRIVINNSNNGNDDKNDSNTKWKLLFRIVVITEMIIAIVHSNKSNNSNDRNNCNKSNQRLSQFGMWV